MYHYTRVEQCRGFEGIFVHEVGADEPPLHLGERQMLRQRLFHLLSPRFERGEQVPMSSREILQH